MKTRFSRAALLFSAACLFSLTDSQAAVVTNFGQIVSLRVEGPYGFIDMGKSVGNCDARFWVDMNSVLGRSVYATAMMAFSQDRNVYIRGYEESEQVYGACGLYDIHVVK
jgi:hypothetical protein